MPDQTKQMQATAPPGSARNGAVPRLADGVELLGEYEGSGFKDPRYLIRRGDGRVVQVTRLLHLIAEQIDGRRDHEQIAAAVSDAYGKRVSSDNVAQLVDSVLTRDGVVEGDTGAERPPQGADPLLALKLRFTLVPERAVNLLAALLRPLFWPPVIVAALAGLVVLDVWYFGIHGMGQSLRDLIYQPLLMLMIYGLMILSVAWHELGHATACRYGGARPGRIGFGIYIVWPAFFTDVTDALSLGKAGRVRTDLGGIYFNVLFSLAVGGAYFVTRMEPLLVLIAIQHLLMLYNFMPFLRLDGYHAISDLTGIPDLFKRIKPTLKSLVPFARTPGEVRELKPWARGVVTLWVLLVVPVLLYLFAMMVIGAPRILATGWDSLAVQWDRVREALGAGQGSKAAVSGIQAAMIVLPTTGMIVTLGRVAKRAVTGYLNVTRERPVLRVALGALGMSALAAAAWVLVPNGEYRPIQPGERWTLAESVEAVGAVGSGRPGLTEERAEELGGAPTLRETGGDFEPADPSTTDPAEPGTDDESGTAPSPAPTPEPTPTPAETETAPTPEPTPTA